MKLQASKMLNVMAITPQGHKTIIQALTENSEEHLDENGFPTQRFGNLVKLLKVKLIDNGQDPQQHQSQVRVSAKVSITNPPNGSMGRHGSWENHALSACRSVTTLHEADSRLICRIAPRESKNHDRDA